MYTADDSIIYPDCSTNETELTISKVITDQATASYDLTYDPLNPEELILGEFNLTVRCNSPTYTFIGWNISITIVIEEE